MVFLGVYKLERYDIELYKKGNILYKKPLLRFRNNKAYNVVNLTTLKHDELKSILGQLTEETKRLLWKNEI